MHPEERQHCLSSAFPANCRDFVIRVLPVLLVAVLLSLPAAADEPRFFIERIEVTGIRWSSENVLLAESRLDPGRTYTEGELRDAMARIRRLPFVLHTDFRLEKGTEREQYVLVIAVDETSPLFGSLTMARVVIEPARRNLPDPPPGTPPLPVPRRRTHWRNQATFGGRLFVGANGVFHAGLEKSGELLEGKARTTAGYTHYDVFGSGASIAVAVSQEDREYGPFDTFMRARDDFSYAVVAAVPIFSNQSLRASWDRTTFLSSLPAPGGGTEPFRFRHDTMRLSWTYDTTDDPLLPSSGTFVNAGVQLSERRLADRLAQTRDASAQAVKYWDVTPRHSLLAGAEYETYFGWMQNERRLRVGYSGKLFDRDLTLRWGDLRFDAEAERIWMGVMGRPLESRTTVSGGISYRNRWGIARFELEYLGWRDLR